MATPPARSLAEDVPHAALRYRDFRCFQAARITSVVSSEMVALAVAWQVYSITGRALSLGYVGLAQFLPSFLLFLVAGLTIDHVDRRKVLLCVQSSYAVLAALLLWYTLAGVHSVALIYCILVGQGTVRAFGAPAGQALMPELVPTEHFANAVTWGSNAFMVATIVGPGLGGLVYGWFGAAWVYGLAVAAYLGAVLFTGLIHTRTGRMEARDISIETLLAGFRYVWEKPIILGSISMDLFAVLLGGATALLPMFADILHIGVRGLGLLKASNSTGALLMAVALAFFPLRKHAGRLMMICVGIFGAATIGFGLSHTVWLSLLMLVMIGASDMVSVVVRQTLVQIETPSQMRGRVSAVNMLFIGTSNQFGEFESGVTADWWGAVGATVIGGIGTLAVVGLWWWRFPQLRKVESLRLPTAEA